MVTVLFLIVSFGASVIGSICGIGGGVIIKPALDATGVYSVSTISFMSGCIVLSMSSYSVIKARLARESVIRKGASTYLGIGAAIGGILGKQLFDGAAECFPDADFVGVIQAAALFSVVLATVLYTICRERVPTRELRNPFACGTVGLLLGLMSSFLGIGGGPMNLVVLHYFFSMKTKTAAQNSLYIILLSQIASLLFSIVTRTVPEFPAPLLLCMAAAGILGGMVGRTINRHIDDHMVDRLFLGLLAAIMGVCCYNFFRFL